MPSYPLPTLAPTITAAGISIPTYNDIYESLRATFQGIYGTDAYIDPDSQDGQLLAIIAKAIADCNDGSVTVYSSFSPATAQGSALSNNVKINGIARAVASNSQVVVTIDGVVGTIITNGIVADANGNQWDLPSSVVIPLSGSIDVTATCTVPGSITAVVGAVNQIITPTLGWQTVTNASEASPGAPVESDAALRQRQTVSVALPSLTVLAGIVGAVQSIVGVTQVKAYENDTNVTDGNGLPPHSISLVVLGGDATAIATAIANKKTPGAYTYGTTLVVVPDSMGIPHDIRFYVPTPKTITVAISVHPLNGGYTSAIGAQIKQALMDYINALTIGDDIERVRLYLPAQLYGAPASLTYNVTSLQIAIAPGAVGTSDLVLAFNERAITTLSDITLTVV